MTTQIRWRKPRHSTGTNSCVEVAGTLDQIRDSKNPDGPILRVDVAEFVAAVKAGRFPR
ncbi:DUF397 domain-containing protein [Gandjariella thermophila]|uniref:DUF397 domain-containing protein n=1 Tax=Gandjariella thermophila TaxID=1931992 RepID=A0A4D4J5S4_9PSEU|nr:DUF397 domain-containing protein [Gandjariella thermophila]GDY32055.1 hypothetical protein GTS_36880 [Gandjariella thermophila]